MHLRRLFPAVLLGLLTTPPILSAADPLDLSLHWEDNYLTVRGENLPGGEIEIHYLEAYCRPNSHTADWVKHTVIGHETERISISEDARKIELRCTLNDGVVVDHTIRVVPEGVDFQLVARNPTQRVSQAHWAQPCIRVGRFTGTGADMTEDKYAYLPHSFVFLDSELARMPTKDWATEARYVPGQVWVAPGVEPDDVNPRPLNRNLPSNGLIGCFSKDGKWILATAWQPYQELFQGVIRCLHSDFRIGGLQPGETKQIRGKLYILPNDIPQLLQQYHQDFPEHRALHTGG